MAQEESLCIVMLCTKFSVTLQAWEVTGESGAGKWQLDFNIRLFGQQREGGPQEDSTKIKIWWLVFWGSPVRAQASLKQGSCPENGDKETDRKNVCELKLNMEIEFVYKELKEWTLI